MNHRTIRKSCAWLILTAVVASAATSSSLPAHDASFADASRADGPEAGRPMPAGVNAAFFPPRIVEPGMTAQQARDILGEPDRKTQIAVFDRGRSKLRVTQQWWYQGARGQMMLQLQTAPNGEWRVIDPPRNVED